MAINFGGNVYDDAGNAVSGASVKLLETGTTNQEGSTVTTDSDGRWDFSEADQDRYDVEITKGSSVRRIKWSDEISLKELDVRNNVDEDTPAATFTNLTNNAANQVAVFSGANSTKADDDEIYLSFKMHDSAGNLDEFARMTVVATDVTSGSEDGQFEFDVLQGGSLIKAFTIASSTAGAQSIDFNQDSVTFGTGTAATDITLTFDAESADGVITWMEDEDYFKFSDEILMNGTEKILFGDTATFIHQSSDGVMTVDGEATIDLNASTAVLVSNDLKLNSDSAVLGFGADNDTTLTHTDGTGLTLNSTNKLTFGDTGTFIHQSSDGVLTITSDTTVDINGAVAFDGAITGATNITLSGELDAATLDISGNADIDGTLEADAITVDGTALATYIRDTVGTNMLSSNTESGITVTYDTSNDNIDFAIDAAQTTITSLFATDIKIGEDDQTKIDFEDANTINFYANNAKEVVLAENSISPGTSDGTALGTTSLMWSDLFLASGSVINFNNGDMTLTHSSNTLTAAGGTVATAALTTSTIVASGIVKTDDTTNATSTTDGSLQTDGGLSVVLDAVFGDDVKLLSDSSVLAFGADGDATLTHTDDTGITLNSTNKLMFNDASQFVQGSSATVLSIGATDEIDLTATAVDLNGTLDVSGNAQLSGTVTVGADGSGTDVIFYSGTSGDNLTWDASEEVLQITGTNGATALDVLDGDVRVVDTLYLYDRGGETISSDGTDLTIASGDDIFLTATGSVKVADKMAVGVEDAKKTFNIIPLNTQDVSTSATTISGGTDFGVLTFVTGEEGVTRFADLVIFGYDSVTVISSHSVRGSPTARTYSVSGQELKLAMDSGTYDISVLQIMSPNPT